MKKILLTIAAVAAMSAQVLAQTTTAGDFTLSNRQVTTDGTTAHRPTTLIAGAPGRPANGMANGLYSFGLFVRQTDGTYVLARNGDGTGVLQHRDDTTGPSGGPSGTTLGAGVTLVFDANNSVGRRDANTTITFQVRAWETAAGSYDAAVWRGTTGDFTSAPLGGSTPNGPVFTPNLSNLGFNGVVVTPEPSTYALGALGLGALALIRRRK